MRWLLLLLLAAGGVRAEVSIEIDLTAQETHLLRDGRRIATSAISSGRAGHETRTGRFRVREKDREHESSMYGRIVDARGRVWMGEAEEGEDLPAGGRFIPSPMRWFIRFDGANGLHEGPLPGYPASHGCVRLEAGKAELFYKMIELGAEVRVHGRAPVARDEVKAK